MRIGLNIVRRKAEPLDITARVALDRMERAGYLPELRGIAQSTCVPFWWHGYSSDGTYKIHHNGTICFLKTGMRIVGVTAHHVFDKYRMALEIDPQTRCQFGGTTIEPISRLISENRYLDLATFDLSTVVVAAAGATAHVPIHWPTQEVKTTEVAIYGGYPGSLREEHETTADIPFQWFAGSPLSVTPENLKLHIDMEHFHQPLHGAKLSNWDLGGMSGGPVFRLVTTPIERLELAAFIYESQPNLSLVYARPSHYITQDGSIDAQSAA